MGMELLEISNGIIFHQIKYAIDILRKFEMLENNFVVTPIETRPIVVRFEDDEVVDPTMFRQLIDSLRYLCQSSHDTCFYVGLLNIFMSKPLMPHLLASKRVLSYVNETIHYAI